MITKIEAAWSAIVEAAQNLPDLDGSPKGINLRVDDVGVGPDNRVAEFASQRLLDAGGAEMIKDIERNLLIIHRLLRPFPILGGGVLRLVHFFEGPWLSIGPWASNYKGEDADEKARRLLETVRIAVADGTQAEQSFFLDLGGFTGRRGHIWANKVSHVRELYTLHHERTLMYQRTSRRLEANPFIIPTLAPMILPSSLWTDLWAAVGGARSAGVRQGQISLWGEKEPLGFEGETTAQDAAIERVIKAVGALYGEMRARAPVLTSLDRWHTPGSIQDYRRGNPTDVFFWGPGSQSLELMNTQGIWNGPHPAKGYSTPRFQHAIEQSLAHLAALGEARTGLWMSPDLGLKVPGQDPTDASEILVALARGNKPAFVPGLVVRPKMVDKGEWTELAPLL